MTLGMVVKFCIVTGRPANKSRFHKALSQLHPELADKFTIEVECFPNDSPVGIHPEAN